MDQEPDGRCKEAVLEPGGNGSLAPHVPLFRWQQQDDSKARVQWVLISCPIEAAFPVNPFSGGRTIIVMDHTMSTTFCNLLHS